MMNNKNTARTFYSVKWRGWGMDAPSTAWFDSKEAAYDFADHDYHDKPVAHTYRNAESIAKAEERVNITKYNFQ